MSLTIHGKRNRYSCRSLGCGKHHFAWREVSVLRREGCPDQLLRVTYVSKVFRHSSKQVKYCSGSHFLFCTMESNAFASLATLRLPSACRLLSSACCPDKDLIVLISRLGGHDKLSLWKLQGSKKWEVDVGEEEDASVTVAALVWSPSGEIPFFTRAFVPAHDTPLVGQTIAVVHDSAHITIHSVQDGRVERRLSIPFHQGAPQAIRTIAGVCWFAGHHSLASGVIPDIFKRNGVKVSRSRKPGQRP